MNDTMNLAPLIDHTFLKPVGSPDDITRLCREAKEYGFASVCVHPCEVARCSDILKGSKVKVCTVVGFPLGQNMPETILFEANAALLAGADELDFVLNVRKLKEAAGKGADCEEAKGLLGMWTAHNTILHRQKPSLVTKLIIECCYLTDDEKIFACRMAKQAGFDFVKTSTGFGTGGATAEDVALMRRTVGPEMGVKAAGGIRTREKALMMVQAGASRIGTSAGVEIVSK